MALEDLTGTKYIDSLVATNPTSTDNKSEGDDHIRGTKNVIKNTLPNITGAVTATQDELNVCDGLTATTAELNKLDGLTGTSKAVTVNGSGNLEASTVTSTELAYLSGATSGTAITSGDITDTTVALDNYFTSGSLRCYKIGSMVTLTWTSAAHSSGTFGSSSSGLIPAAFRPAADIYNVHYAASDQVIRSWVKSTGQFLIYHYDWAGVPYTATAAINGSITYTV